MNTTRHHAREVALQILYRYDVEKHQSGIIPPSGHDLAEDLKRHFEHFQVSEGVREFSAQLVSGTMTEIKDLDAHIEKHAQNWKISRMAYIDRNLLRMAIYEMLHFQDIPKSVTIDEAIELAKQFGTAESPAFINGMLDSISKPNPV